VLRACVWTGVCSPRISLPRCCCSWPCDAAPCVCTATWPLLYRQLPLCAGDPLTVENVPMAIAPWRSIHQLTHPFCTRSVPCPVARPQKGTSVELTRRLVGVGEPRRLAVKTAATMVEASTAPVAANAGGDNPDVFLSKVLQKILSEKEVSCALAVAPHTHTLLLVHPRPLSPQCACSCALACIHRAPACCQRTAFQIYWLRTQRCRWESLCVCAMRGCMSCACSHWIANTLL
jgi:hypothetical protein